MTNLYKWYKSMIIKKKTPMISRGIDIDATFHNDKRFQET
mgnify:CR=1 FL=1